MPHSFSSTYNNLNNIIIFSSNKEHVKSIYHKLESLGYNITIAVNHSELNDNLDAGFYSAVIVDYKLCYNEIQNNKVPHLSILSEYPINKLFLLEDENEVKDFKDSTLSFDSEYILTDCSKEEIEEKMLASIKKKSFSSLLSKEFLHLIDFFNLGINFLSPDLEIIYTNKKLKELHPSDTPVNLKKRKPCYTYFHKKTTCNDCPCVKTLNDGKFHEKIMETYYENKFKAYKVQSNPVTTAKGDLLGIIEVVEDITEQNKLASANQMIKALQQIIYNAYDCIIRLDNDFNIISVNSSVEDLFGYYEKELVNQHFNKLLAEDSYKLSEIHIDKDAIKKDGIDPTGFSAEFDAITKNKKIIPIEVSLSFFTTSIGEEFLVILRDISQRKQKENEISSLNERLKNLAYIDPLTNTFNRNSIFDLIDKEIKKAENLKQKVGILFLDIDNFKEINDNFGHKMGDNVLKEITEVFGKATRKNNLIGRIGGDEFLIVLPDIKSDINAFNTAKRIRESLINDTFLASNKINIKVSIGITMYPENGNEAEDLLNKSDKAMYFAKKEKKTSIAFYNSIDGKEGDKFYLSLKKALSREEFRLYYHPIVNQKGQVSFLEALIRWHSKEYGFRSPGEFIPMLEATQQMEEVSYWTISQILQDMKAINKDKRFGNLPLTLNLSCDVILKNDFLSHFGKFLKSNKDANMDNFMVEVAEWGYNFSETETDIVEYLNKIKNFNIKLLLDDFGAGYSSIKNLVKLPVDIIKIDKSLVDQIDIEEEYSKIIFYLMPMLKSLNFKVIAEGVETKNQFEKLVEADCDYFQGFYFSKPVYEIQNLLDKTNGFLKGEANH